MKATCSVSDCELFARKRGYCETHYSRLRQYGTTELTRRPRIDVFWSKVDKSSTPDECWEWTAYRDRDGYGKFHDKCEYGSRPYPAPRWLWVYLNGPIPDGLFVRHKCDNPPCVNPDHLELGTHLDNCRDREERGRTLRGRQCSQSVLTEPDVRTIRSELDRGVSKKALAERFGVSRRHVNAIALHRVWRHV